MNVSLSRLAPSLLLVLLAGCSHAPDNSAHASRVAITTVQPVQRTFHDDLAGWGTAIADSSQLQRLSLGHGGQVTALPVSAGQPVHKGQVLLRMATDPSARADWHKALSALKLAKTNLQRTRRLAGQHLATREQLAAAQNALTDAQAALQAQRALGNDRRTYDLRAPADGVITTLHAERGDRVAANAPLMDFSPSRGLEARLGVQPDHVDAVQAGMPVKLTKVYDASVHTMGTVDMVGHAIDPASGLVPVRVTIPAAMAAKLVAGSPVSGRIQTRHYPAWAVPRAAVLHHGHDSYLFQDLKGHARRVNVTVVQPHGDTIGVHGKLQPDLPVIVMGAYELSDGDAVRKAKP